MPPEKLNQLTRGIPDLDTSFIPPSKLGLPEGVKVYRELNNGEYLCLVPINLIERRDAVIDPLYLDKLKQRITSDSISNFSDHRLDGQSNLGLIAQVEEEGKSALYLCRGFHLCEAKKEIPNAVFLASVKINCTKDEMIDLRIRHATYHKPVAFGRVVEWTMESWDLTPWSKSITLFRALSKLHNSVVSWKNVGLTNEEAEDVKEWVEAKCRVWKRPRSSLLHYLGIARRLNPRLIDRTSVSGIRNLKYSQRRVIAEVLAGKYGLQIIAAEKAEVDELSYQQTKAFARSLLSRRLFEKRKAGHFQDEKDKDKGKPKNKKRKEIRNPAPLLSDAIVKLKDANMRLLSGKTTPKERKSMLQQSWFGFPKNNYAFVVNKHVLLLAEQLFDLEVENLQLLVSLETSTIKPQVQKPGRSVQVEDSRPSQIIFQRTSEEDHSDNNKVPINGEKLSRSQAQDMVRKAKEGDITNLYKHFYDRIVKFILFRVSDRLIAEDLTQEVFIKVMENLKRFQYRDGVDKNDVSLTPWIFRIVRNTVIDHYRTSLEVIPLEAGKALLTDHSFDDSYPDGKFSLRSLFEEVILRLPPLSRKVMMMEFALGLEMRDIASILNKKEGAVRALKMRAVHTLQSELKSDNN